VAQPPHVSTPLTSTPAIPTREVGSLRAFVVGATLAWIALTAVALVALFTTVSSNPWTMVSLAVLAAMGTGAMIAAGRIGRAGLAGAVAGLLMAMLVPLGAILAIRALVRAPGTFLPDVLPSWVGYLEWVAIASFALWVGARIALHLGWRLRIRVLPVIVLGAVMFGAWMWLTLLIVSIATPTWS
jgi:hypothetical protein